MDGFFSSRCLNDHIDLPDKIGLFLSGPTTHLGLKNGTKIIIPQPIIKLSISQPFEELQGLNLELKLITPISITVSHFETKKYGSHLGTMAAILDF